MTVRFRPEKAILELDGRFHTAVDPADFPQHIIRWRNQRWAEQVGLGALSDAEWIEHFGKFAPLEGSLEKPLAQAYHGHQFQVYNPQIGDGRGFLYAQLRDQKGRLLDLGTKGSGQTPWSRTGDGRLTLKGGVREIMAAGLLEALGVYTSKAFSLIETGEQLHRHDEPRRRDHQCWCACRTAIFVSGHSSGRPMQATPTRSASSSNTAYATIILQPRGRT